LIAVNSDSVTQADRACALLEKSEEKGAEHAFFIPHSSDQCQPLDLLTFSLLQKHFSSSAFHRLENPQPNKVVRILGAFSASAIPRLNDEAFVRREKASPARTAAGEVSARKPAGE
jgi:hypothetical protein